MSFAVKRFIANKQVYRKDTPMISCSTPSDNTENLDIAIFIRFLKQIRLKKMLSTVDDSRQQLKVLYQNHTLLLSALSVFFFDKNQKIPFRPLYKNCRLSLRKVFCNT